MKHSNRTELNPLPVTRFSRIMLATCGLNLLSLGVLRAQSNVEYNFRQQHVVDGQGFGSPHNNDPVPVLSMDCLAANGYGQWTLSSTPGQGSSGSISGATAYQPGWYLLANGLYAPSTGFVSGDASHPGCIPPGVVNNEPFTFSSIVKATANLDGMAAFVSPHAGGGSFDVSGFTASDLDLSLSFLSNPTPWTSPTTQGNMKVVTHSIHSWPSVSTSAHPVVISGDFRDCFDVCSDPAFIYIVWSYLSGSTNQVWVVAFPIGSSTPAVGPVQVDIGADNDIFPTITCDPRGGGYSPAFDIAYVDKTTEQIMTRSFSSGAFGSVIILQNFFTDPGSGAPIAWGDALHARIVRSSVYGSTSTLAVYAIINTDIVTHSASGQSLLFYPPSGFSNPGNYVAGTKLAPPTPLSSVGVFPFVYDGPIIAFANPYDNQAGWQKTDQFHCLYQYDQGISAAPEEFPLIIVRGSDVNASYPNEPCYPLVEDTRLVLNPSENDPYLHWYIAAVNQMEIHVHWRANDVTTGLPSHFYSRDMNRTFDEDIEENTLVTDQCTVSDGTAHGGTVGAAFGGSESTPRNTNTRIAVWTDPNYGIPNKQATLGLFSPRILTSLNQYVGTLNFVGSNVKLLIDPQEREGVTLSVMPYFYFNFPGTGQGVTIDFFGTFDYWGLLATHDVNGVKTGISTPFTDGTADGLGGGTIDLEGVTFEITIYAYLNVHGGSDFYIGGDPNNVHGGKLISNIGDINVFDEASVYPTTSGTANPVATGHMTLLGQSTLTYGYLYGHIPWNTSDPNNIQDSKQVIMTVDDGNTGYTSTNPQFSASDIQFQNSDDQGTSELRFGHANRSMLSDASCLGCVWDIMDGCRFSATQIHVIDPPNSWVVEIQNSSFDEIRDKCIFAEDDNSLSANSIYGGVYIDGNNFGVFAPNVAYQDPVSLAFVPPPYGIYLKNFDMNAISGGPEPGTMYAPPEVSNNSFTYSPSQWNATLNANAATMWTNNHWFNAAIGLENTSAYVESNDIEDPGYSAGIALVFSNNPTVPRTFSIICNNTIKHMNDDEDETHLDGYGMLINDLNGTVSWNDIESNDVGIEIFDKSAPRIDYNTITGNNEGSLEVQSGPNGASIPDMSNDVGQDARNTLSNEGSDVTGSEDDANTPILSLIDGGTVNITDGDNNIIPISPWSTYYGWVIYGQNTSRTPLGNVEGNYWGAGNAPPNDPTFNACWGSNFCPEFVSWDLTHLTTSSQSSLPTFTGCELMWYPRTHKKGAEPQSSTDSTACASLYAEEDSFSRSRDWEAMYDTGKRFIETCYNYINGQGDFNSVFPDIIDGMDALAVHDTSIFIETRQWLESVLYLNTADPNYFCLCVADIGATFQSVSDTSETLTWKEGNRSLALIKWLWENDPQCDTAGLKAEYRTGRYSQREDWLNDTTVPYDTTLPTMQQLGLDTLFAKHLLAIVPDLPQNIILSVTASPNPVSTGTVITFGISQEAYVKIQLFDVLGHEETSPGFEGLFEPGNHEVPLDLQSLPSGTYFARIMTAFGSVETVKIVKE